MENNQKQWYEGFLGLVVLSLGVNLLSNFLYDKARNKIEKIYGRKEDEREKKHLLQYHRNRYHLEEK